jgi:hypothetical protein
LKAILIAGAYSPGNIGDGLLAELSVQLAYEATQSNIYLSALDPKGFKKDLLQHPWRYPGLQEKNIFSSLNILYTFKLFRKNDLAVLAIGGEYLIFSGIKSMCKSLTANGLALLFALLTNRPVGFLPQGIVLAKKMRRIVLPFLSKAKWILLRDEESMLELDKLENIHKAYDLAILDIKNQKTFFSGDTVIGSILHEVSTNPRYLQSAVHIAKTSEMKFFVQSNYGGNNMDGAFLEKKLNVRNYKSASHLYKSPQNIGVVISTRLHGAIGAVRNGIPAIHIAYSRKGKAVFGDLGILDYCVDFDELEPFSLLALAHELNTSEKARKIYWEKIAKTNSLRKAEKLRIVELIRSLAK